MEPSKDCEWTESEFSYLSKDCEASSSPMALAGMESRGSSPATGERRSMGMPFSSSIFSLQAAAEKPLPTLLETMRQRSCSYSSRDWRRRSSWGEKVR